MIKIEDAKPYANTNINLPVDGYRVCAGFPSPADDYIEDNINLDRLLCDNQPATFFMWVKGDSMKDAGIYDGDLIIVDRSLNAVNGDTVVAMVDGLCSLKTLDLSGDTPKLTCANAAYPPYLIGEGEQVNIWGVVKCNVHWLGNRKP